MIRMLLILVLAMGVAVLFFFLAQNQGGGGGRIGNTANVPVVAVIIVITVLLATIVVGAKISRLAKKKRQDLLAMSSQLDLTLIKEKAKREDLGKLPARDSNLKHKSPMVRNLYRGILRNAESEFIVADFSYVIMAGQVIIPITIQLVLTDVPKSWPVTRISANKTRGLDGKIRIKDRIKLDNEGFNQLYRVESENEDFAIALLDPEMQKWISTLPNRNKCVWHIEKGRLAYMQTGRLSAQSLPELINRCDTFIAAIPKEMWT